MRRDVNDMCETLEAAVLDQLPLRPAMRIAEIGCGSGDLTWPLATRLPHGQVHAIDSAPTMLAVVCERARAAGHANIATYLAAPGEVPLPPGGLDGIHLTLVLHALPAVVRAGYLARLRALMRPGGWRSSNGSVAARPVPGRRWPRESPRARRARCWPQGAGRRWS